MSPIAIQIQVTGQNDAKQAFIGVAAQARAMWADIQSGAGTAKDSFAGVATQARVLAATIQSSADDAKNAFGGVASSVNTVNVQLQKLTTNTVDTVTGKVTALGASLRSARNDSSDLKEGLQAIGSAGRQLEQAGESGIVLSNSLIRVYRTAEAAKDKMDAMMQKRGDGGRIQEADEWVKKLAYDSAMASDVPIRDAVAGMEGYGISIDRAQQLMGGLIGQARLYTKAGGDMNQKLKETEESLGKAFSSGNIKQLRKVGITFDPADLAAFDKLKESGASWAQQQEMLFQMVKKSLDQYALSITEGMSESEKAANRFELALHQAETNVGQGAADAEEKVDHLTGRILVLANASPAVQRAAGALLYYGSYATTAAGGILNLGAQISLVKMGMDSMGITGVAAIEAISAAAIPLGITLAAIAGSIYLIATHHQDIRRALDLVTPGARGEYNQIFDDANKITGDPNRSVAERMQAFKTAHDKLAAKGYDDEAEDARKNFDALSQTPEGQAATKANPALAIAPDPNDSDSVAKKLDALKAGMSPGGTADAGAILPPNSLSPLSASALTASPTSMPGGASLPGINGDLGGDGDAISEDEASAESINDKLHDDNANLSKADKRRLHNELYQANKNLKRDRAAQRVANAQKKALEKQQKAQQSAFKKQYKAYTHLSDESLKVDSDIAIEQIEADSELRIKQIEAGGDEDSPENRLAIAQIKADEILKKAQYEADAVKTDNIEGEGDEQRRKILAIARIKAQHEIDMAQFDKRHGRGHSVSDVLAHLRAGGSLGDYEQSANKAVGGPTLSKGGASLFLGGGRQDMGAFLNNSRNAYDLALHPQALNAVMAHANALTMPPGGHYETDTDGSRNYYSSPGDPGWQGGKPGRGANSVPAPPQHYNVPVSITNAEDKGNGKVDITVSGKATIDVSKSIDKAIGRYDRQFMGISGAFS